MALKNFGVSFAIHFISFIFAVRKREYRKTYMKNRLIFICLLLLSMGLYAQNFKVASPDGHIILTVGNYERLTYSVALDGKVVVGTSPMGFALKGERDMDGNFEVTNDTKVNSGVEAWKPVVKQKHAECRVPYNELVLQLKEKSGQYRRLDVAFRVMNDGVAFRYTLYGIPVLGNRQITRELTGYALPEGASLWIPNYEYYDKQHPYRSSQEGEFIETPVKDIKADSHAALPGLIKVDSDHWLAVLEADNDNYPAFYLGRSSAPHNGFQMLDTKLTPIFGEPENGIKVRFNEQQNSSWRVIMVGHHPGKFIESEMINALNAPCAIKNTAWIKPGVSAWDHWWSGEVKMEMDVIKKYIDFASKEGWPYMLIDWTWYGPYNVPQADITKPAPQLNMPEILNYTKQKNVGIWLWLRCEDANNNDQYKDAFPLFHKWGVKGVKIDFMDRDDQDMVNWYRRIVKAAADNELMVDFHGAYKPDGLERTYPNLMTREGVMGAEYYKFSNKMTPEHNVKLAYTRMLAGPMDYTPGGFLNVTSKQFKQQSPTLVANTRAAELAKLMIYESPFLCFCDNPDHVYGQTGEDFVSEVPSTWDDTRFIGGTPDTYVAIAHRSGDKWYVGVLNNSHERDINLDLPFLSKGEYQIESWEDGRKANTIATDCRHQKARLYSSKPLRVRLANAGGYVAIISKK